MTGLNLDVEAAVKATDSIADVISGMKTNLSTISDQVESARAFWQGSGQTSFVRTADSWDAEGAKLNKALDELEQKLREGYKNYNTTDEEVKDSFTTVAKGLDGTGLNL